MTNEQKRRLIAVLWAVIHGVAALNAAIWAIKLIWGMEVSKTFGAVLATYVVTASVYQLVDKLNEVEERKDSPN